MRISDWSSDVCSSDLERGAKIFVTDINKTLVDKAVNEYGAEAVGTDEIYDVADDVYSPCALGGTLNEQTLPRFKFKVVCGTANNQLASNEIGDELEKRGILYAPAYAVNAGGVMHVALELTGYNRQRTVRHKGTEGRRRGTQRVRPGGLWGGPVHAH